MDVVIPQTSDGKKRGFGFVQYKKVKEATAAIEQFNGTLFMGTF